MPKQLARNRLHRRPDAAANARPRKVAVTHAGGSKLFLTAALDRRTKAAKAYHTHVAALEEHIGDAPTPPQARLIDQAARLALLGALAWDELQRQGPFDARGNVRPAVETYTRAIREERATLQLIGLERREPPIPTLAEYVAERYGSQDDDA